MLRFAFLEDKGLGCAVISSRVEGDCSWSGVPEGGRYRLAETAGYEAVDLVIARQVHGKAVLTVAEAQRGCGALTPENAPGKADALITRTPGLPIGVAIADCVPVLLYAPEHGVAGVVHAGREGTQLHISAAAVAAMTAQFQVPPESIHAVLGPSAGPCCYEVDPDCAEAFAADCAVPPCGRNLDLWQANQKQLCAAGVPAAHIEISGICTLCSEDFFSYRSGDLRARNLAVVML